MESLNPIGSRIARRNPQVVSLRGWTDFATRLLPAAPDAYAPDGSEVRLLCQLAGGSMAHFRLPPRACSTAVVHRTVGELWFVVAGEGELWRSREGVVETVALRPGVAVSIPVGTSFQFRAAAVLRGRRGGRHDAAVAR